MHNFWYMLIIRQHARKVLENIQPTLPNALGDGNIQKRRLPSPPCKIIQTTNSTDVERLISGASLLGLVAQMHTCQPAKLKCGNFSVFCVNFEGKIRNKFCGKIGQHAGKCTTCEKCIYTKIGIVEVF